MSAFLGPIHHWLFNKIRVHEELEGKILESYKSKYGSEIDQIIEAAESRYGEPLGRRPLEDQIDLSNIHQWLNSIIGKTETRLAYILGEVFRKHSEEAFEIAFDEYKKQGAECGLDAKKKGITNSAPEIYKALNDYMLEGMPCDRVNFVIETSDEFLKWKTTECLHRGYWREAGADIETLYKLRFAWVEAFVGNSNPEFKYTHSNGDNIDSLFIHEIKKSS
ncbi:hypothetical protein NBE98_15825 [Clostridium swellfunianum]|uniref:hypothetical protein n=1 Tax=Clostridium swellfunianum TaxID=1367462 RepID=UPI00202FE3F5|nr:hypothetical protein [Clostridium swellfunianum]MCM0649835.1 hypothetical protein [Clostridium swellfunianum]